MASKSEYFDGIVKDKPYIIGDDDDHVPIPEGQIKRDWKFRKTLLNAVEGNPNHPIFNGIIMAAHHLISVEGMAKSGLGSLVEDRGYNINLVENLIFLPYELEGACHLGVQLHRGDHTAEVNGRNYHAAVKALLEKKINEIEKCESSPKETLKKLTRTLNGISELMAEMIEDWEVFLSGIAKDFEPDNAKGCGNTKTIGQHRLSDRHCHLNRDHQFKPGRVVMNVKNLPITLPKQHYKLKAGQ
ncbi:AHH domain-containing protein [Reinekea sp. G2M2-21]|uniref:AHH domain-containing protein n=1 Tax=Reinekea sp. G2M2-21 TaxID=2788942 RepID=UPI0018ABE9E7|nr:AHH domain-containing protein [Reinekea sp. G2M2-21]